MDAITALALVSFVGLIGAWVVLPGRPGRPDPRLQTRHLVGQPAD